ncbi:hypothetical protein PCI56_01300 [Plesiomonas shigelloides subsp. oncorhynchi]|nr:hypothetical protein [Plesiomonas shigelloides]
MEQIERATRYLARIEAIYEGVFSSTGHDKDSYDDDVISFFIHCYHIRDWIIHLNVLGVTSIEIDNYINRHHSLMLCADLANGAKHCKLTRSLRTRRQPHIAGKQRHSSIWYAGSGGGEMMKCKYTVLSGGELVDVLELARECVALWGKFIDGLNVRDKCRTEKSSSAGAST